MASVLHSVRRVKGLLVYKKDKFNPLVVSRVRLEDNTIANQNIMRNQANIAPRSSPLNGTTDGADGSLENTARRDVRRRH